MAAVANHLPDRPAIAPWCRVVRDDGRVLLEHGGSLVTLEGRAAAILLPALLERLDGTRDVAQIVRELGPAIEPSVRNALALLHRHGLLSDGEAVRSDGNRGDGAIFVAASVEGAVTASVCDTLADANVTVVGRSTAATEIRELLEDAGVGSVTTSAQSYAAGYEGRDMLIAAIAPDEVSLLPELNVRNIESGRPWLAILPHDGRCLTVGPLFLPRSSACYECFQLRRGSCSGYEEDFELIEYEPTRAASPLFISRIASGLAAMLAVRWLAVRDPSLPGRFYTFQTTTVLGLAHHHALRVPRCPACGTGGTAMASPWFCEVAGDR